MVLKITATKYTLAFFDIQFLFIATVCQHYAALLTLSTVITATKKPALAGFDKISLKTC